MIKRYLPTRDSIKSNRWLRWLGPRIHDPQLWHINRNSVARGVAIGAFFGLMVPVAQIPAAAVVALALRGNLWIAAVSTLISNPLTYGPLYLFAYRLGRSLLPAETNSDVPAAQIEQVATPLHWLGDALHSLSVIGAPLLLGMALMAITAAVVGYFGIQVFWRTRVLLKRRRKRHARLALLRTHTSL
ncbi:MAG: DUF2062 domain-containing protein [Rhodocyclales bacterium]|nr:DUF2062 domain-containing protein [Rhodocyclales bacterium]